MPKGYMISAHRSPADPDKAAAYRQFAKPAIEAAGGKFLAGGGQVVAKENGIAERDDTDRVRKFRGGGRRV